MEYLGSSSRFDMVYSLPAKAESVYYRGRLLAVATADGRAAAAADEPGLIVVGRIESTVDNSDGAHGDKDVAFGVGVYLYKNSPTSPVTQVQYAQPVYVENDITVRATPGEHNVFAGFFRGFSNKGEGVWVDTRPLPMIAAWFGGNPNSNWRLSSDPDTGAPILQLWNQAQEIYQTIQLDGLSGIERLVIQ